MGEMRWSLCVCVCVSVRRADVTLAPIPWKQCREQCVGKEGRSQSGKKGIERVGGSEWERASSGEDVDTVRGTDSEKETTNKNQSGREEEEEKKRKRTPQESWEKNKQKREGVFSFCFGLPGYLSPSGCHLCLWLYHTGAHICGNANTCVTYEVTGKKRKGYKSKNTTVDFLNGLKSGLQQSGGERTLRGRSLHSLSSQLCISTCGDIFCANYACVWVCAFLSDFPWTARCTVQMVPHPFLSIPSSLSSEAEGKEGWFSQPVSF